MYKSRNNYKEIIECSIIERNDLLEKISSITEDKNSLEYLKENLKYNLEMDEESNIKILDCFDNANILIEDNEENLLSCLSDNKEILSQERNELSDLLLSVQVNISEIESKNEKLCTCKLSLDELKENEKDIFDLINKIDEDNVSVEDVFEIKTKYSLIKVTDTEKRSFRSNLTPRIIDHNIITNETTRIMQICKSETYIKSALEKYGEKILNKIPSKSKGRWEDEEKVGNSIFIPNDPYIQCELRHWRQRGIPYKDGLPDFSKLSYAIIDLPPKLINARNSKQKKYVIENLMDAVNTDIIFRSNFTDKQISEINNGKIPKDLALEHNKIVGKVMLVHRSVHSLSHYGGQFIWGGGSKNR